MLSNNTKDTSGYHLRDGVKKLVTILPKGVLVETVIVKLTATPPYDFDLTAAAATHFSGHYGAEAFQNGVFQSYICYDDLVNMPMFVQW